MIKFNFDELGGMPWYQDQFKKMQNAYMIPLSAIVKTAGSNPTILHGVEETSPGVYSDGYIVYGGEIIPFVGGSYLSTVVVKTLTTTLLFADGSNKPVQITKQAEFGTGTVQFNFSDLKKFQVNFGKEGRTEWMSLPISTTAFESTSGSSQYLEYKVDYLNNICHIRGAFKHQSAAPGTDPLMIAKGMIPVRAPKIHYFRSNIETHSIVPKTIWEGALYTSEVMRIAPSGIESVITISSRALQTGLDINFLHYFQTYFHLD